MFSIKRKCWLHLPLEIGKKTLEPWKNFFKRGSFTIRELSSLIGTLRSTFRGNKFGPLYYGKLDKCKTFGLKKAEGNFDTLIKLMFTLMHCVKIIVYTNASMHGWGHTVKEFQQDDHGLTEKRIDI